MIFVLADFVRDMVEQLHEFPIVFVCARHAHGPRDRWPGLCHVFQFSRRHDHGWKPICFPGGAGGATSSLMAAKMSANCSSYFFSRASILRARSRFVSISRRSCTNVRMIAMLTATARALRRTLDSIATPCSVNATGSESARRYFWYVVTICDHMIGRL